MRKQKLLTAISDTIQQRTPHWNAKENLFCGVAARRHKDQQTRKCVLERRLLACAVFSPPWSLEGSR